MHHAEEIVALEARSDEFPVGDGDHRVGVPDDDIANDRISRGERLTEPAHVDRARAAAGEQIGSLEGDVVDELLLPGSNASRQAATTSAPRAG